MHRYYAFNEAIKGDMQRVKKGERIMYTNEDLACDGRMYDRVTTVDKDNNVVSDKHYEEIEKSCSEFMMKNRDATELNKEFKKMDEISVLINSRSNGTYNEIAEDAGDIISILGDDIRFTYFFSQIANKLARMKHRYSVEDSLLDIAGYATLELERLRSEQ